MIVLQPPNEFSSFNNSRNLDLSNTSIGAFSQIPSQNIPSMYQTTPTSQYQTQQPFVYDQSTTMNPQPDGSKTQQNTSPNIIPSTTTADSNVLPPLSEVFPSSSTAPSPTQSQVQVQTQVNAAAAAAQNGFFAYPDVNAANAAAAAAAVSYAAAEGTYGNAAQNPLMSQQQQAAALQQQPQIASNISSIPGVDPRTLPRIELQQQVQTAAMLDHTRRNSSNALLAINTGLAMGGSDPSPLSAGSSAGSSLVYQHAHHQALLNSHFMAAAQSMNNGMMPSSQRMGGHRKGFRPDDGDLPTDRPQKVYSFVALPGINTKKRPRRRYDEIERHYACNYSGCTKSYGTLNHLNAHVQMQKHGPKRHPSEFKELRKQWRRQKREEEERKAAEINAAKNAVGLNIPALSSI